MLEAFDFVHQKPEHLKQTSTETLPGDPKTYSFKGHYNYLEAHTPPFFRIPSYMVRICYLKK